jgi:hypothetical protein
LRDSADLDPRKSREFDFSTPEGFEALRGLSELVLEIRDEVGGRMHLYERTLGLAVLPVLARRAAGRVKRRIARARAQR